jgi:hypothetical protein
MYIYLDISYRYTRNMICEYPLAFLLVVKPNKQLKPSASKGKKNREYPREPNIRIFHSLSVW